MLKEKIYFITAVGTDIGKTFLVENICRNLLNSKLAVEAIKPVQSGFLDGDVKSDSARILQALGKDLSQENFDIISPWHFEKAISPHFAARAENQEIIFSEVANFCHEKIKMAKKDNQFLFIEGAGGLMTPLTDDKSFLDLLVDLKIPVLLLSANYLGAISHTLCAVETMKSRGITPEQIIINDYLKNSEENSKENSKENLLIDISQIIKTIKTFSGVETISINHFFQTLPRI